MTEPTTRIRPGASELMRALGLLVDGPARWPNPVASREPGVFVIELGQPLDSAPLDVVALRRWIEHVPDLRLDGQPPTPQLLARRLAEFWVPGEPIVYVGRSARAIGARVAAMIATPLGDAQPYSGGHWLKALATSAGLRTWWAETEAHEEYEDALLEAVTERSSGMLPFANLPRAASDEKRHGLTNSLRATDKGSARPSAGQKTTQRAQATTRARRAPVRDKPQRPAPAPTYVSSDGLAKLTAELEELRVNVRPQVIARVKAARELGDLRENGDYEYARKEQSFVEGRIQALEAMIKTSVLIEEASSGDGARLGSTVEVEIGGERETYLLVGPAEADPVSGRISNLSPVGRALIGARAGDEVTVQLPSATVSYRVVVVS